MQLAHKIRLNPTADQRAYFERAAGTARFVWNWSLAEWNRQYASGGRPSAAKLKKQFNATKYRDFPWLDEVHRDSHAQPFANLAKAWSRYFKDLKKGLKAERPRFKKKNKCFPSFYVANDKFSLRGHSIRLPKVGAVEMTEELRFEGKVMSATVSRTAGHWFVAIQVDVPDAQAMRDRTANGIVGVDLGVSTLAMLSTGEAVSGPKPLRAVLRRLRIRSRRHGRKLEAAKVCMGFERSARLPKGARLPLSEGRAKSARSLARLHARVTNVRQDFMHKLTTRLCRENQAIVIEDLNVQGMLKNERLARAISDVGFGMFRRQLEYKVHRYGTRLVIADRWFPSSRLCSVCCRKKEDLKLSDRTWVCQVCGVHHDRDLNAARNLERLATETALPVASSSGNGGTATQDVCGGGGKVTSVRNEVVLSGASGQKGKVHVCALSR